MENDTLLHYGVKGMKWGVRRTPSQISADRNARSMKSMSGYRNASANASSAARGVKDIVSTAGKGRAYERARKEMSTMTDQQLRDKVNRMNLEQQYANLSVNRVSKGRAAVENALTIGAGALAVTSSALGIALAIKELRK